METKRVWTVFAALTGIGLGLGFLHEPETIWVPSEVKAGKEIYELFCAGCHGQEGYGTAQAVGLRNRGLTREYIVNLVRTGNTVMPKFANMSDSALANVSAYVLNMQ
ncbi:MAG: cytochrome c [Bacteroidetes bacterium]|nr:cytochrome c [Bacteroidota bacterium]